MAVHAIFRGADAPTSAPPDVAPLPAPGEIHGDYLLLTPATPRPRPEQTPRTFLALELTGHREVVLSVFPGDPAAREEAHRTLALYRQAGSATHIPMLEGGLLSSCYYLTTPWAPGVTLEDLLRDEVPLGRAVAVRILRDLAAALRALHSRGLCHGNLNPDTIRIAPGVGTMLAGFAPSPFHTPHPSHPEGARMIRHAAPEWHRSQAVFPPSDVYALGLVAYQLFTGRALIPAGNVTETLRYQERLDRVIATIPDLTRAGNLPPFLDRALRRMLSADPSARPSLDATFLEELDAACPEAAALSDVADRLGRRFGAALAGRQRHRARAAERALDEGLPLTAAAHLRAAATLVEGARGWARDRLSELIRRTLWHSYRLPDVAGEEGEIRREALALLLARAAVPLASRSLSFATNTRLRALVRPGTRLGEELAVPSIGDLDPTHRQILRWIERDPRDERALATLAALTSDFCPSPGASVARMQSELLERHGLYRAALLYRARDLARPDREEELLGDLERLLARVRRDSRPPRPAGPSDASWEGMNSEEFVLDSVYQVLAEQLAALDTPSTPPPRPDREEEPLRSSLQDDKPGPGPDDEPDRS